MSAIINGIINGWLRSLSQAAAKPLFPLLSAVALGGCAIHPVQQDVTGVKTTQIVNQIRCETRLAVLDKAIELLRDAASDGDDPTGILNKIADELANTNRERAIVFDPRRLPASSQDFYYRYIDTVIAYDFLLNSVEDNRYAVRADPFRFISGGTFGVAFGGSSEFNRDNLRKFDIADSFGQLLEDNTLNCAGQDDLWKNYVYPIAGRVGMKEVISTFIDLNEGKRLSVPAAGANTFADTLKFSTTLMGSVGPHVQIDPIGSRYGLANPTDIGLSGTRTDVHTLTIGLAIKPRNRVQRVVRVNRPIFGPEIAPSALRVAPGSNAARAFQAIEDLRYRNFLDRAGTLSIR